MKKHITIFIAGAIVVVPLAITVYVIWSAGVWMNTMGNNLLRTAWHTVWPAKEMPAQALPAGVGAAVLVLLIYLIGRLTHFWLFRALINRVDRMVARVPGVKVIYESVRDLMKLLGGGSDMGRVVQCKMPGTNIGMLGILTNTKPAGTGKDPADNRVAVFLPFSYMFGGPTIYVSPQDVQPVDMSVEEALKIAATAHLGSTRTMDAVLEKIQEKPPVGKTEG